jgi:adenine-specific DNA-methyltransferase
MVIKYLGSKRTLIPTLSTIAEMLNAEDAVDLFTGTTRVAQAFKKLGITTTANDLAYYAHTFARTYIETDADQIDRKELQEILNDLNSVKSYDGFFTENYCRKARFIQPKNGKKIDAIRDQLETFKGTLYYPILLTSLIEAADKVDSTTGIQMAYLKQWAKRSYNDLNLVIPDLIPGEGKALRGDALETIQKLPSTDLLYLDPPYNQHRYDSNYHIWNSLVIWDKMEGYGVANKRKDLRDDDKKSIFNKKREIVQALDKVIKHADADSIVVSFNNEGWVTSDEIFAQLAGKKKHVLQLDFDFKRYVGAQIGVYNPQGEKTGEVKALRNLEHIFIACDDSKRLQSLSKAFAKSVNRVSAKSV